MHRWLWDSADQLLALFTKVQQSPTVTVDLIPEERKEQYQCAYDQLLWEIATASTEQLKAFAARFWDEPYINLPTPLLVIAWRLLGLESAGDLEALHSARWGIAAYCDPLEEEHATRAISRLIDEAGGSS